MAQVKRGRAHYFTGFRARSLAICGIWWSWRLRGCKILRQVLCVWVESRQRLRLTKLWSCLDQRVPQNWQNASVWNRQEIIKKFCARRKPRIAVRRRWIRVLGRHDCECGLDNRHAYLLRKCRRCPLCAESEGAGRGSVVRSQARLAKREKARASKWPHGWRWACRRNNCD